MKFVGYKSRPQGPVAAISKKEKTLVWERCCSHVSWRTLEHKHRRCNNFAIFAFLVNFFLARDVKSGLLRCYKERPFRISKGMVVFSRSIHHSCACSPEFARYFIDDYVITLFEINCMCSSL